MIMIKSFFQKLFSSYVIFFVGFIFSGCSEKQNIDVNKTYTIIMKNTDNEIGIFKIPGSYLRKNIFNEKDNKSGVINDPLGFWISWNAGKLFSIEEYPERSLNILIKMRRKNIQTFEESMLETYLNRAKATSNQSFSKNNNLVFLKEKKECDYFFEVFSPEKNLLSTYCFFNDEQKKLIYIEKSYSLVSISKYYKSLFHIQYTLDLNDYNKNFEEIDKKITNLLDQFYTK
ncbi:MAG: hypothetical protein V4525_01755 [Pseudomonadota bacterium]